MLIARQTKMLSKIGWYLTMP